MTEPRSLSKQALHVFVLASLAAAPILIVADAQFFIGRGASGGDVVAVALILMIGAPAALALAGFAVSAIGARAGWWLHLLLIGALVALLASEALYPLGLRLELQAPVVLAAGIAAALAYARNDGVRSAISRLAPLPFLVLFFVFIFTPVSSLVFGGDAEAVEAADPAEPAPVVVVVFDELPGYALMDARGELDAKRFPAFAALGEDATWYPNATTTRSDTELAVPTIATGRPAPLDSLPTASDHPESLFTLLSESHKMHVSEPWTNLCPASLCEGTTESTDEGDLGSMLATLPSILGYVAVPDAARIGIPSPRESGAISRPGQFRTYVSEIEPQEGPELHFLHVLLPHKAWRYLPTGERYPDTVGSDAELGGLAKWADDDWFVLQHQQRFLLQLQFTDKLLGELMERLRDAELYERSLIVVTADHGVSFRAGEERRDATDANAPDIASVPLFVKEPGQGNGAVDDREASTVDVLPTIADALGAELPWEVDGRSVLGEPRSERPIQVENLGGGEIELNPAEFAAARDEVLQMQIDAFGEGAASLYAIGPNPKLHGEATEPLAGEAVDASATIVDGTTIRDYDTDLELVPARIAGDIDGADPGEPLALALNGRIAATTYTYEGDRGTEFAAMVPPDRIAEGDNEPELFAIEGAGSDVTLHPVELD